MSRRRYIVVAGGLYLLSGIPALVYQVAWQRILCLHSGTGIYSIAMIVAAFMMGLGLGSQWGGTWSARLSARQALRIFAALEAGVGMFALGSCWLYYDLLYQSGFWTNAVWWQLGLAHFTALVVPTTFMGMTLPMLVRATVLDSRSASRTISYLYGANALGAAVGSAATPWILVGFVGIRGSVATGAMINFAVALGAIVLFRRAEEVHSTALAGSEPPRAEFSNAESDRSPRLPKAPPEFSPHLWQWGLLYGLSGFIALGLEMLWFRVLDVAIKSNSLTYGTVLAIFLGGLAVGCLAGGASAHRSSSPLRGFLTCQCFGLICAGLPFILVAYAPDSLPLMRTLVAYWQETDGIGLRSIAEWRLAILLYAFLPAAFFLVPTMLMGASFAYLQQAVHENPQLSGRRVGWLQAGNILGSTCGSLVVGLIGLNLLGTMGSLQALLVLGGAYAVAGMACYGRRSLFSGAALALALLVVLLPDQHHWWARLHGTSPGNILVREDASGVAVIAPSARATGYRDIRLNGKGQATIPFGATHTRLGAMPALLHPAPRDIAVIGLGSAGTAFAANCRPETAQVRVFEICGPLHQLLQEDARRHRGSHLEQLLDSPRVRVLTEDGRNAVVHDRIMYDIIEADALRTTSAFSGNLYSVEFFESCAARLKPGGMFCTWAPTRSTRRAFCDVFPYVVGFRSDILIGSRQPIRIDRAEFHARARSPEVTAWLGAEILEGVLSELDTCTPYDRQESAGAPPNHDLFPRDEFETIRYVWSRIFSDRWFRPRECSAAAEGAGPAWNGLTRRGNPPLPGHGGGFSGNSPARLQRTAGREPMPPNG